MADRLAVIVLFALCLATLYVFCMHAVPRHGWLRFVETICAGIIMCYLCQRAAAPFGLKTAQSPLAALSAGYWGLPGTAFATFLMLWP